MPLPKIFRHRSAPSEVHDWPYPTVRTYAVITAATVACPSCGYLMQVKAPPDRNLRQVWVPHTHVLECRQCEHMYQLGVLLWAVPQGKHLQPADQKRTLQEIAQQGQQAGGYLVDAPHATRDPVNRTVVEVDREVAGGLVVAACVCAPYPWRGECPVHGQVGTGGTK